MRWLFPLFLQLGVFALIDLLQRAPLVPMQWGILLLDGGLIVALVWLLCRHFQAFLDSPRIGTLLSAVLILGLMIWWRSAPDSLPAERTLQYQVVTFLHAEERQHCRSIWAFDVNRCESQVVVRATDQREWPLAFADLAYRFQPVAVEQGQALRLGVHDGKVYSATREELAPTTAASHCSYRQNPLARRTQVTWVCGDAPAGVAGTFAEQLAAQQKSSPVYHKPEPLLYADSARLHQQQVAQYHQQIKALLWAALSSFR